MTPEQAAMDLQGLACKLEAREIGVWNFYNDALKIIHTQRAEAVAEFKNSIWKPFSEAPKDGTIIYADIVECFYFDGGGVSSSGGFDHPTPVVFYKGAWHIAWQSREPYGTWIGGMRFYCLISDIPLPIPPAQEGEG